MTAFRGAAYYAPLPVRLWRQVEPRGECWEWTGYRDRLGYGHMKGSDSRNIRPHRVAWELAYGPVPPGMELLHSCDNPPCVRLTHLRLGTHAENMAEAKARGRLRPAPRTEAWAAAVRANRASRGSRNSQAKLTEDQVRVIKAGVRDGELHRVLATAFGVSESAVDLIAEGRTWRHVEAHRLGYRALRYRAEFRRIAAEIEGPDGGQAD